MGDGLLAGVVQLGSMIDKLLELSAMPHSFLVLLFLLQLIEVGGLRNLVHGDSLRLRAVLYDKFSSLILLVTKLHPVVSLLFVGH